MAGKKLSEALQLADEIVRQRRQLLQQATQTPNTEIITSAAPGTSGTSPQTPDVPVKVEVEGVAMEATIKEDGTASPKKHLVIV